MNILVLAAVVSPIFLLLAISRNHQRQRAAQSATVGLAVDATGAHRTLADGRTEDVAWHEVTEVDVFTARVGPHEAAGGAVVLYGDATRGCIIPLDQVASSGLVDHVHRLPGFDLDRFVAAVSADPKASARGAVGLLLPRPLQVTTVIWKREDDDGDAPSR